MKTYKYILHKMQNTKTAATETFFIQGSDKTTAKYSRTRSGTTKHDDKTYHDAHPLYLKIGARPEKEAK